MFNYHPIPLDPITVWALLQGKPNIPSKLFALNRWFFKKLFWDRATHVTFRIMDRTFLDEKRSPNSTHTCGFEIEFVKIGHFPMHHSMQMMHIHHVVISPTSQLLTKKIYGTEQETMWVLVWLYPRLNPLVRRHPTNDHCVVLNSRPPCLSAILSSERGDEGLGLIAPLVVEKLRRYPSATPGVYIIKGKIIVSWDCWWWN